MYSHLEIFVLTYNRAPFLKQAMESLCNQTAKGFSITVLDNCSTDNTQEIVEEIRTLYPKREINFISSKKNIGGLNNITRAFYLSSKTWTMIAHDDDIIHPQYIEKIMKQLDKNPDIAMGGCAFKAIENPTADNWKNFKGKYNIYNQKEFTEFLLTQQSHCFPSAIYRTEFLKKYHFEQEKYGKIADRPLLINIASHGKTVILQEPYFRYRVHPSQDSNTITSGPFKNEWFELMNCYKNILSDSWLNYYGRIYNIHKLKQLKAGYKWMKPLLNCSYKAFKKDAFEQNLIKNFEKSVLTENFYSIFRKIYKIKITLKNL